MTYPTDQERFWSGDFGDEYSLRNAAPHRMASYVAFFRKALACTSGVATVLELGPNVGLNLRALGDVLPDASVSAVEINHSAAAALRESLPEVDLRVGSILDFQPEKTWDFVFTKGVLIHINPDRLPSVYDVMYRASGRYIMVAEYYNPVPVEIEYRGHKSNLFKRDFAGDLLDRYSDLSLVDYGFVYHRDPQFPLTDLSWFVLEKQGGR